MIDDLLDELTYGARIHRAELLPRLGVELVNDDDLEGKSPAFIRAALQRERLQELAAVVPLRDALLEKGRYLKQQGDAYQVLSPDENAGEATRMIDAGTRKVQRAAKLLRCMPTPPREQSFVLSRTILANAYAERIRNTL